MEQKEKYIRLIKDTLVFALGSLGSKIILFLLVPLYTNYLTTTEFGTAELVFTFSQILIPFVSLVIFDAVIRFGLQKDKKTEEVLFCGIIVWILGTLVTIIITPVFSLYPAITEWKWYLCAYTSISILLPILMNYLKTVDENKVYAFISVLQTLFLAGLNLLFLVCMRIGVAGYLISNIGAMLSACVLVIVIEKIPKKIKGTKLNKTLLKEMVTYSAPLVLNNVSWWIIHSSDKIMIEIMIGASALGVYSVSTKIPSLINVFISIFSQAWGISSIREVESTNDKDFYSDVLKVYSFFVYFTCISILTISKPFMMVYVGSDFNEAWRYVPLLLLSATFSAIASYYGTMYSVLKKSVHNMRSTLVGAVINVLVNYLMIKQIGLIGAAVGTVIAYFVIMILRMLDIHQMMEIKLNKRQFRWNCAIVTFQAVAVTLDFKVYLISCLCMAAFVFNNYEQIIQLRNRSKALTKEK